LLALPLVLWQIIFFLVPFLYLLTITFWRLKDFQTVPAFTLVNYVSVFGTGYYWAGYLRSLQLSAITGLVVLAVAVPSAYALVCYCGARIRTLLVLLMLVPLLTSYVVRVYAWNIVLADNGLVNATLRLLDLGPFHLLYTKIAIVVGLVSYYLPVAVLGLFIAISSIEPSVLEATTNLGCGPFRILWEIVVPSIRRAIIFMFLFLFILAFGDVISAANLGGNQTYLLSTMILDRIKIGQWPEAAVMAMWTLATFSILLAGAILLSRRPRVLS
jgi:spermidine/putrescine transport system permease protein/putrescine transport system permease protein